MTIEVYMHPQPSTAHTLQPSGITTILTKYAKYAPDHGIRFLSEREGMGADLIAVHAGMGDFWTPGIPYISHLHGLYWTGDYSAAEWEYKANRQVIHSMRIADTLTVPSPWVASSIARDFRVLPHVLPHGIDVDEWVSGQDHDGYVLWNKNRAGDVCSPHYVNVLARALPKQKFLTTYSADNPTPNIKITGVLPHNQMKQVIQGAEVYLSTTKETFGVGILEAMASGVPVLAFREGGAEQLIIHGETGYLADPDNADDLLQGLLFCRAYRDILGENGRIHAHKFGWPEAMQKLHAIYSQTIASYRPEASVSVVIPCYNYGPVLERAVRSVLDQTYPAKEIIIVDDGSTDNTREVAMQLSDNHESVRYIYQPNQGVANARNTGCSVSDSKYLCCLDADDEIAPSFLELCVQALERDPELGIAYTRLLAIRPDGKQAVSPWPAQYNFDAFLERKNQVPTCAVFQRRLWVRLGGYRQRYAPTGAGAEDAEFFLRIGAYGYKGLLVTDQALFHYHLGGRVSGDGTYQEVDWLAWHPWTKDRILPFAAVASTKTYSHPVYQRDRPAISVIIPCGPDHQDLLSTALDGLESQEFRSWEAIVVCDGFSVPQRTAEAYPYVHWIEATGRGAGAARNLGANQASSPYLLFLDADDWLSATALGAMHAVAGRNPDTIVYTDYIGHAFIDQPESTKLHRSGRLISYDEKNSYGIFRCNSAEYDCLRAQAQPLYNNGEFYIWSIIESLVPALLHHKIGGFDEKMVSWEDWDYWIRMARAGICFTHLPQPLVHYRFYSGTRREIGRQQHKPLLEYLADKYAKGDVMPCGSCGKPKSASAHSPSPAATGILDQRGNVRMSASDMVDIVLNDGNIGEHHIVGAVTKTSYGYRKHGEAFSINTLDQQSNPDRFLIDARVQSDAINVGGAGRAPKPPQPPKRTMTPEEVLAKVAARGKAPNGEMERENDFPPLPERSEDEPGSDRKLSDVWGIGPRRVTILEENNVDDLHELVKLTQLQIVELLEVTDETAHKILESAKSLI